MWLSSVLTTLNSVSDRCPALLGQLEGRFPSCCFLCFAGRVLLQKREAPRLPFFKWTRTALETPTSSQPHWFWLRRCTLPRMLPLVAGPAALSGETIHLLKPHRRLCCPSSSSSVLWRREGTTWWSQEVTPRWAGWKKGLACPSAGGISTAQPRSCSSIS